MLHHCGSDLQGCGIGHTWPNRLEGIASSWNLLLGRCTLRKRWLRMHLSRPEIWRQVYTVA